MLISLERNLVSRCPSRGYPTKGFTVSVLTCLTWFGLLFPLRSPLLSLFLRLLTLTDPSRPADESAGREKPRFPRVSSLSLSSTFAKIEIPFGTKIKMDWSVPRTTRRNRSLPPSLPHSTYRPAWSVHVHMQLYSSSSLSNRAKEVQVAGPGQAKKLNGQKVHTVGSACVCYFYVNLKWQWPRMPDPRISLWSKMNSRTLISVVCWRLSYAVVSVFECCPVAVGGLDVEGEDDGKFSRSWTSISTSEGTNTKWQIHSSLSRTYSHIRELLSPWRERFLGLSIN